MNITIKYEDFIKLVMKASNLSGEKLDNNELLKIFINTLSDKKNKNDIIAIFVNALLLLPAKETDEFLKNKKIDEHIKNFNNSDKEKLILNLYTAKIKCTTFDKVINSISYNKNISVELNNHIEDYLLRNTKKNNFLRAMEIGYTPSQTLFYCISDIMERSKDKTTPYYDTLRNMLCVVYAFNEKFIQLKENHINLFMFDCDFLERYNNASKDYTQPILQNKHPHLQNHDINNPELLDLFIGKINTNSLSYILRNELTKNSALKFNGENTMALLKTIIFQTPEHQKNSGFSQLINSLITLTKNNNFFEKTIKSHKNTKKYLSLISIIENTLLEQNIKQTNYISPKIKI